ncbi:MAG: adenosylcobalamin-dependent ribonucleoside-diphosphate reductase [Ignavibacteria bacterium]|jgi:ribonucleoside-diphosphate reductase alpha chain|nr:adenosylcobalamin-dependent ribonucleoside-diphosphate reductase [Ignavibacteria bacterium]
MHISRIYTKKGESPYNKFTYVKRSSILRNLNGSVVFEMNDIEVPVHWSQLATDILAQKYFRKTGVPAEQSAPTDDDNYPTSCEDGGNILIKNDSETTSETSIRQVVHRLAGTWTDWGKRYEYFDTPDDAVAFYDEIAYMLLNQMAAPNSPQWFNTGLYWAYGITGSSQGHYYVDPDTNVTIESKDAYSRPQTSACFIQSINDDLVNDGGIFDLLSKEARIFKYGSGTGTNFSSLRAASEHLSGGGVSSGLMSFLKVFDRAAGAIKSGGTTRRAAKMVILNIDHPDIEEFIEWKSKEEDKVAALVSGSKIYAIFMQAIIDEAIANGSNPQNNIRLRALIQKALNRGVPINAINKILDLTSLGFTNLNFAAYDTQFEGEAYLTVSGQNSNNSVRLTNEFMKAVANDDLWELKFRTSKGVAKVVKARQLFDKINLCAWKSADPGLQYDSTINEWHTCPQSGRINASNPCSEYMFLDDSACNLASLNLVKFWDNTKQTFLVNEYKHAIQLWTLVLEISVLMAQFPSKRIAELSYEYRTLGLGYANLGSLLMISGIPYDSPQALAITSAISSLLTSEAYATSAQIANEKGTFLHYPANKNDMLRVIRNHRNAAYSGNAQEYEGLTVKPTGISKQYCPQYLLQAAQNSWDNTLQLGTKYGFRNAQVTVIAPTGTIALLMDCDTTGIEPDFAIVKYKKLAGGGYFKIVNQSVQLALNNLGYTTSQINDIEKYSIGHGTLAGCKSINSDKLLEKGFSDEHIDKIEAQLASVFDIRFAFSKFILGDAILSKLGLSQAEIDNPNLEILPLLGFTDAEIDAANDYVCGTMMLEGAPHIKPEHIAIFDCASKCGKKGQRFIDYMAHLRIMSAAQPFITGAISKTVNMPANATVDEVSNVHISAWEMMLKAIAIYRDGSKLSQPLNSAMLDGLDEVVTLGDEVTLDETLGPKEIHLIQANRLTRRKLPKLRKGITREATVGGQKIFLRTGEYEDGTLGEIFLDMYKDGAAFRGMLNSFAILTSKAIQYGVPLDELVDTFTFTKFEPQGIVQGHEAVKFASSVLDYVFRSLGYDYLNRTDFVHTSKKDIPPLPIVEKPAPPKPQPQKVEPEMSIIDKLLAEVEEVANITQEDTMEIPFATTPTPTHNNNYSRAKSMGYTGEQCPNCSSMRVKRNGSCLLCEDCGTTSGCS